MPRTIKILSERMDGANLNKQKANRERSRSPYIPSLDGRERREQIARLERSRSFYIACDGIRHVLGYNKVKQPDGTVREVPQQFQDEANINGAIQESKKGMTVAVRWRPGQFERIFGTGNGCP